MTWSISGGVDAGQPVMIAIDDDFVDPAMRLGREIRLSLTFDSPHMFSQENRVAFRENLDRFLQEFGGVVVAGITRVNAKSYTFLSYAKSQIDIDSLPLDDSIRGLCTATVARDPDWSEYESWLTDELMYRRHDRDVMADLQKVGDTFSLPRDVDFLWSFPSEDAAKAAAEELRARDLHLEPRGPTGIKLVKRMPISLESLSQLREIVLPIAARHGGTLTFWGCHPATFKPPSLLDRLKRLIQR